MDERSTSAKPNQSLEESRSENYEQGLSSLFFFNKAVLGMRDLIPSLHGDACDFIQDDYPTRKVMQMARGHVKTWINLGDMLQRTTRFLEGRHPLSELTFEYPILYMMSTAMNARKKGGEFNAIFDNSPVYHWLYPNIVKGPEYSKDCKQLDYVDSTGRVRRRVTIDWRGVEARLSGGHYRLLKCDDMHAAEEAMDSPPSVETVVSRYQHTDSLTVEPDKDPIHLIGSPCSLHPADVYEYVKEKEKDRYSWFVRPCYDKATGEPSWPERFPRHVLEAIRRKEGDVKFSFQYLLDGIDELVAEFRASDLINFTILNDGRGPSYVTEDSKRYHLGHLFTFSTVDLAGWRGEGDSNAVLTGGTAVDGRHLLLEEYEQRSSPDAVIQRILDDHDRFGTSVVGVEEVAYQECLSYYLDKEILKNRLHLRIVPCKPRGKQKDVRIRGMQPLVRERQILVHQGLVKFLGEFGHFPRGTKHLLDCFAYLPLVTTTPVAGRLEEIEDRERRAYLRAIGENEAMALSGGV